MMKRALLLASLLLALVSGTIEAQTSLPGPASPSQARIYFYRSAEPTSVVRWTLVLLNDAKIGDIGERTYFYRDLTPGAYRVGVGSDVPYPDQYKDITLAPNTTTFIRVYYIPGYGMQFSGVGLNSLYQPTVFGIKVMDPALARAEAAGLSPAQ
jgi:hypothetical protein